MSVIARSLITGGGKLPGVGERVKTAAQADRGRARGQDDIGSQSQFGRVPCGRRRHWPWPNWCQPELFGRKHITVRQTRTPPCLGPRREKNDLGAAEVPAHSLPPLALSERRHRCLARCRVAVRRHREPEPIRPRALRTASTLAVAQLPLALSERRHRCLARCRVAVRRRAILVADHQRSHAR
jgi:hypothetical protein